MNIIGACFFDGSWASGTVPAAGAVLGRPLVRAGGALREFPFIAEQVFEVVVVPLHRVGGPCALQPAGDRVGAFAAAKGVLPAEALLFDAARPRVRGRHTCSDRQRHGLCRTCVRRRSGQPSPRHSSPCGRTSRGYPVPRRLDPAFHWALPDSRKSGPSERRPRGFSS